MVVKNYLKKEIWNTKTDLNMETEELKVACHEKLKQNEQLQNPEHKLKKMNFIIYGVKTPKKDLSETIARRKNSNLKID